jgi:hypothetical protein
MVPPNLHKLTLVAPPSMRDDLHSYLLPLLLQLFRILNACLNSVYGLRKRTPAACFEAEVEAVVCSRLESRMVGGGGTDGRRRRHDVSRATKERERARGQQITKCGEKERGA